VRPGSDTGRIEAAKGISGTVDQFLNRVFPGLVRCIRHNFHPRAQLEQFVVQTIPGIAQNEIVILARHLARQRRHHVRFGVCEYHYPFCSAVH